MMGEERRVHKEAGGENRNLISCNISHSNQFV